MGTTELEVNRVFLSSRMSKSMFILLWMICLMLAMIGATAIEHGTSPNTKHIFMNIEVTEVRPKAVFQAMQCADIKPVKWCKNKKEKNRCDEAEVYNNCKKTCGDCNTVEK